MSAILTALSFIWTKFSLPKIPNWLATFLVGLLLGLLASWYVTSSIETRAAKNRLQDALSIKDKEIKTLRAEHERAMAKEIAQLQKMLEQEKSRNSRKDVLQKERVKYVPQENDDSCNYTLGTVGVLNMARSSSDAASVSDYTGLPDAALRAPSTLTRDAEVTAHQDCAERYNKLKTTYDALRQRVKDNQGDN